MTAPTFVLDAGALIAAERAAPKVRVLLASAEATIVAPASALAQVWREGRRQVGVARILADAVIPPLDAVMARAVGRLLARTGTSDVVDAHVALCALERRATIVTSDPDDLRRLAPGTAILRV